MSNILVTGSNGQLGSEIREMTQNSENSYFFTDFNELDITNHNAVLDFIVLKKINTVINCAAYTAVDKAEEENEKANAINNLAVANFAHIAKDNGVRFIHISTDYVFDGENFQPYKEDDSPNPKSVYGKTKLLGEQAIINIKPKNTFIIRTSWVYSSFGLNFVKTMLRLGKEKEELRVISDQVGTPTYAADLAQVILNIVESNYQLESPQVYHYSNEGACSWYDFAYEIFQITQNDIKLNAITTKDYPTPAQRPYYSLLSKEKIKKNHEIHIPHWKDSLKRCLTKLNQS